MNTKDFISLEEQYGAHNYHPLDVVIERAEGETGRAARLHRRFLAGEALADGGQRYFLQLAPELCGMLDYRIRAYPTHELLTHPFELGLMVWA